MDEWILESTRPQRNLLVHNTEELYLNHYFIPNLRSILGYVTLIHKNDLFLCIYIVKFRVFLLSNLFCFKN